MSSAQTCAKHADLVVAKWGWIGQRWVNVVPVAVGMLCLSGAYELVCRGTTESPWQLPVNELWKSKH